MQNKLREDLFRTPSPAAEASDMSMHVNQKKRLHIFLGCFCVSYCVSKSKRGSGCSQNMKELLSNYFFFYFNLPGFAWASRNHRREGTNGRASKLILMPASKFFHVFYKLPDKLHFTKLQYRQLWLGRNCGVVVPKLQSWSLPHLLSVTSS